MNFCESRDSPEEMMKWVMLGAHVNAPIEEVAIVDYHLSMILITNARNKTIRCYMNVPVKLIMIS